MNRTVSPQQLRIVLLVGLLTISAIAFWMLVMRQSAETAANTVAAPTHATPKAPAAPTRAASPHRTAKPTIKAHRLATHGLPLKVAEALKKDPVVVVALYTPGVALDRLARAEYAAAASAGGAGFVSLDVLRQRDGGPLMTKLGLLEAPAVLVMKRPSRVFLEIEGFADRHTILQAVANAKR
jgi:hypothetical protein